MRFLILLYKSIRLLVPENRLNDILTLISCNLTYEREENAQNGTLTFTIPLRSTHYCISSS